MRFDIASEASAIDDTYDQIRPSPDSVVSNNGSLHDAFICGPRSGHWTVSSGGNRSGIDDRTPTFHNVAAPSETGSVVRVKRVDPTALRKLAAATEAERKAKQEAEQQQEAQQAATKNAREDKAKSEKAKGFYLPRQQDSRGIRIRSREGKDEIIKDPVLRPIELAKIAPSKPKLDAKESAAEPARPPSPSRSVKSAATAASNITRRTTNRIRIVGKNGEEAFVELPLFSRGARSDAAPRSQKDAAAKAEPAAVSAPARAEVAKDEIERDGAAEKEAKCLRDERLAADAKRVRDEQMAAEAKRLKERREAAEAKRAADEKAAAEAKRHRDEKATIIAKRLEAERLAAEPMMHGAMQPPSRTASIAGSGKGSKSSSKVSEKLFPDVFDPVSKAASVASSTTSVSRARSVQQQQQQPYGSGSPMSGGRSRPSTVAGRQEVGLGTYEAAASSSGGSNRAKQSPHPEPKITSPDPPSQRRGSQNNAAVAEPPARNSPVSPRGILKSSPRPPSNDHWHADDTRNHSPRNPSHTRPARSRASASTKTTDDSFPIAFPPTSVHSYQHQHQQSSNGIAYQPPNRESSVREGPTIFAGRGWISPHPLSEAPTWAREEPDPLIQLPPTVRLPSVAALQTESGVRTMTYEEWLAVQNQTGSFAGSRVQTIETSERVGSERQNVRERGRQGSQGKGGRNVGSPAHAQILADEGARAGGGRRNISRTSSHASRHYGGGNWGFRGGATTPRTGTAMSGTYRAPTVRTESQDGIRQQDGANDLRGGGSANVAEEFVGDDGNVKRQLKMPWDGLGALDGAGSVSVAESGASSSSRNFF